MKKTFLTLCFSAFVLMASTAQAATLAPSLLEIEASRGEVVESSVRIINTAAAEQVYYMGALKFRASDEASSPVFIPYEEDHSGLAEWIQFPVIQVRAPARSSVDVPFSIVVPSDVASGGYYAAVTVSNAPSDVVASNGAIIEAKTASLVFLTIKGETQRAWSILDFTSGLFGSLKMSLREEVQYRVQNQGNVHVQPQGSVRFRDLLNRTILEVDANEAHGRVLPGTTRTFSVNVTPDRQPIAIGPIRVTLELSDGEGTQVREFGSFWFLSIKAIVLSVIALIVILFIHGRIRRS